jgi:hypothetical protein
MDCRNYIIVVVGGIPPHYQLNPTQDAIKELLSILTSRALYTLHDSVGGLGAASPDFSQEGMGLVRSDWSFSLKPHPGHIMPTQDNIE